MGRTATGINGITTTLNYDDGDCLSMVNFRKRHGSIYPVSPRKVTGNLQDDYDYVFIHKMPDYENWIGVKNYDDGSADIYNNVKEIPELIKNISGHVNGIEQIGNTLSVITDDDIFYLLHKDDGYLFLGNLPDLPAISFSTAQYSKTALDTDYDMNVSKPTSILATGFDPETAKAVIYRIMNDLYEESPKGVKLFDLHFIQYAFRLYDGSLVKYSIPVLIAPQKKIYGSPYKNSNESLITFYLTRADTSSPFIFHFTVYCYLLQMIYDFTMNGNYSQWNDIIKSVDIFMSPALGLNMPENIRKDFDEILKNSYNTQDIVNKDYNFITEITNEETQRIKDMSSFYLVKSINLGDVKVAGAPYIFPDDEFPISKIEDIIQLEEMGLDSFSNNKTGAKLSYAYNNRLHLAGIKTTFFSGFNYGFFSWGSAYNGTSRLPVLDFQTNNPIYLRYYVIEVVLNINGTNKSVYSYYDSGLNTIPFMSSFLSYPDPRAKYINVWGNTGGSTYRLIFGANLTPHNFLNIAYYFNPDIKPIEANAVRLINLEQFNNDPVTDFSPNEIKVSETNNPFYFSNKSVYRVGNGEILGLATVSQRISEGSFGQYPLYVFTTTGIYSLAVGSGEVAYSQESAPTSYEIPTSKAICETSGGVVFTSKRGLCIIFGQGVELLSAQLLHPQRELNIEYPEELSGILHNFSQPEFSAFLSAVENIAYNPNENEVIIIDKDNPDFIYVYNFYEKQFYISTEKIDLVVKNTFPNLLVVGDRSIKDYSQKEIEKAHVSFLSRPISFGSTDWKKLERMILRGTLLGMDGLTVGETFKKPYILAYTSIDGVNFKILRGIPINSGSYKDLDMGLFARSKYRYFMLGFACLVDDSSQIDILETEIVKEYDSTKMR
jgi:hypothetical protein